MAKRPDTASEKLPILILAEIRAVSEAVAGDVDVAHRLRVGVKRIRAWLRLLRPALGEERYGYENLVFRNLSRPFAALRERDALKTAIAGLKGLDGRARHDLDTLSPRISACPTATVNAIMCWRSWPWRVNGSKAWTCRRMMSWRR